MADPVQQTALSPEEQAHYDTGWHLAEMGHVNPQASRATYSMGQENLWQAFLAGWQAGAKWRHEKDEAIE